MCSLVVCNKHGVFVHIVENIFCFFDMNFDKIPEFLRL
jgi:hypothetical protein